MSNLGLREYRELLQLLPGDCRLCLHHFSVLPLPSWAVATDRAVDYYKIDSWLMQHLMRIHEFFRMPNEITFVDKKGNLTQMEQKRTPLYDSVFKFKDLLQYLKDKSFSDEVSITMRLDDPTSIDSICVDIEIPNITREFMHSIISPWVEAWFMRSGIPCEGYTIEERWPADSTVKVTYKVWLNKLNFYVPAQSF